MRRRRRGLSRQLVVFGTIGGSTSSMARGLWRSGGVRRVIAPLAVFLCLTGGVLVLATGVEALAPFVYSLF